MNCHKPVYKDPSLCYDYKVETDNYTANNEEETMTKQEELDLIRLAQTNGRGADRAKRQLIEKYERLIHKLAHKFAFTAPSHQHEDLVQEGRIGVLDAITSFDPEFGASFMTWAYYNIRGHIAGCGRSDGKQPRYPISVEDSPRAYNVIDESQDIVVRDTISDELILRIVEECCGGLNTKRASIVMDRFGLLGRKELRNQECVEKYGITKYAVNSHTYNFKRKAREKFPELASFL